MPIDRFAPFAPFYDLLLGGLDESELAEALGLPASGMLLDAGGGTGRVAESLHLRRLVDQVVVLDESPAMLERAERKEGFFTVRAKAQAMPFHDGSFSRIIVVDAFHHLGEQRAAAAELWRVLAPGGRLVIEEPDIRRWPVKLLALAERLALFRSRFLDPQAIVALFEELGGQAKPHEPSGLMVFVIVDRPDREPSRD